MNIADFTNLYDKFTGNLSESFRANNIDLFKQHGLPSRKQEAWRYANIGSWSLPQDLELPSMQPAVIESIPPELIKDADIVNYNGNIIVMNDDIPGVSIKSILNVDIGVITDNIAEFNAANPFIAYTIACLSGGFYLKVDENLKHIPKIKIVNYKDKNVFANEFNWVDVGENSKLDLCSEYIGNAEYWLSSVNYATLAKNSGLISEVLQNESDEAISHSVNIVMQDAASNYAQKEFACGAKVSRSEYTVCLNAEGATADLSGINQVKTGAWHNTNIMLKHMADNCMSKQNFRSILHTKSMGIFLGHIYVPKGIKGSQAYQDSKNMLLGSGARAIAKPYLEIYADDVVCTHSATVGQIDENMLFFLRSRGLGKGKAKLLLLKSFICEICNKSSAPHFEKKVINLISGYNAIKQTSEDPCEI